MKTIYLYGILCIAILSNSFQLSAQTECNLSTHVGVNFGPNADDQLYDVKMQDDGKFLAFGSTYYISSNTFEISICRFLSEDGLDTTFANKGKGSYKFDSRNTCYTGAIRGDGKIYAGGYEAPGNGLSTFRPYVARFTADGLIDSTFGNNGSAKLSSLGVASVFGIQPVANQKVLVGMIRRSPASIAVARLKNDGTFDSTFATNGVATHTIANLAYQVTYGQVLFKANGKIVFVGKTLVPTNPYVAQLNPDGTLDTNFANKGILVIPRNIKYNFSTFTARWI